MFRRSRHSRTPHVDLVAAERGLQRPQWGSASRCTACNGIGYLDHIDMVRRVMHQHCVDCGHTWRTSEAETLVDA